MTVIDLAAVARSRAALRALVVAHPSLTAPEAQARLTDALPELIDMPPRLDPNTSDSITIGARLTPDLVAALDREVERQRAEHPDLPVGRSNVLRGIIRRALLAPATSPTSSTAPAPAPATTSTAPATSSTPQRRRSSTATAPAAPSTAPATTSAPGQLALIDDSDDGQGRAAGQGGDDERVLQLRLDLEAARARHGLSGRALASRVGTSDMSLRRFLSGATTSWPRWGDQARAWLSAGAGQ